MERFKQLVLSVYLYNEWRGFLQLERDLIPALEKPGDCPPAFLAEVKKHAADERKHYFLFKEYFRKRGVMPFRVGRAVGYFDFLSRLLVGKPSNDSAAGIVRDRKRFADLCRAVVVTEHRGIQQVDAILRWPSFRRDHYLLRIFRIIRRDEPSHYLPYEAWLKKNHQPLPSLRDRVVDVAVHYSIAVLVIPFLFLNPVLPRLKRFPV